MFFHLTTPQSSRAYMLIVLIMDNEEIIEEIRQMMDTHSYSVHFCNGKVVGFTIWKF